MTIQNLNQPEPKWRLSRWAEQLWPIVRLIGAAAVIIKNLWPH